MANLQLTESESSFNSSEISLGYQKSSWNNCWKHFLNVGGKQYKRPRYKNVLKIYSICTLAFMIAIGFTTILIWLSLLLSFPRRNQPKASSSRVSSIVDEWKTPADSIALLSPWSSDFTQSITPMPCHSHNDYWRTVPLFEALAAGCIGIEADIFLPTKAGSRDLLIGHKSGSVAQDRTLQSMYISPLITILENLNNTYTNANGGVNDWIGVFQSSPNTTLTLLLDFKSNGAELWPYVNEQLENLRSKNWLTHWSSSSGITWAPIIIVATGNAPFDLLNVNTTFRDIFYDAPLDDISNPIYNNTNSYYASVSMSRTLGKMWFWELSSAQLKKIGEQVNAANSKGLQARYWDTPGGPMSFKDYISGILVEKDIGILNVDGFSSTLYFLLLTRFGQNRLVW